MRAISLGTRISVIAARANPSEVLAPAGNTDPRRKTLTIGRSVADHVAARVRIASSPMATVRTIQHRFAILTGPGDTMPRSCANRQGGCRTATIRWRRRASLSLSDAASGETAIVLGTGIAIITGASECREICTLPCLANADGLMASGRWLITRHSLAWVVAAGAELATQGTLYPYRRIDTAPTRTAALARIGQQLLVIKAFIAGRRTTLLGLPRLADSFAAYIAFRARVPIVTRHTVEWFVATHAPMAFADTFVTRIGRILAAAA